MLDHTPALPAAPSLPQAHPGESIIGQAASGLDGADIGDDGTLGVDTARLLANDVEVARSVEGPEYAGLRTRSSTRRWPAGLTPTAHPAG